MNKVITINLNGNAYQLEEGGYDALRDYLDTAAARLEGNPDRDEIIADIEQAIADKCRAAMGAHRTVVLTKDVAAIIAEMGPVVDGSAAASPEGEPAKDRPPGGGPQGPASAASGPVRRLYRIYDGAMISGVCNCLAAYFAIDVTLVRLAFVILAMLSAGSLAVAYLVMVLVVPAAKTPAEQAAATGGPSTAQEFIRRAQEGYYEGMKTFRDKHAYREWKRRFRHEMRGWGRAFRYEFRFHGAPWCRGAAAPGAPEGGPAPAFYFALPFLSLLKAVGVFLCVFAILSLVTTGAVFGLHLPAGLPIWAGVILLIFAYHVVVAPIKALRHACYYGGQWGPYCYHPFAGLWHACVWLAVLALLIWLGDRYVPEVHQAILALPGAIHRGMESVQQWWSPR
jgi:phage shock protein PspC (stress-responsive transcriptional regulator)